MNFQSFVKSIEWQEIKAFFKAELEDKPMSIKTDGISAERIALEVLAANKANEKINKIIKKFERLGLKDVAKESWK